jgi:excisionase family DNA binding protein
MPTNATTQDIADLRALIEARLSELLIELRKLPQSRFLTIETCASYLGRTEHAVRYLVKTASIPYAKVGGRVQFDKDKIDRWFARQSRRVGSV